MQEEWQNLEWALAALRAAIAVEMPKSAHAPNLDQAQAHERLAVWASEVCHEQYRAAMASLEPSGG